MEKSKGQGNKKMRPADDSQDGKRNKSSPASLSTPASSGTLLATDVAAAAASTPAVKDSHAASTNAAKTAVQPSQHLQQSIGVSSRGVGSGTLGAEVRIGRIGGWMDG